MSKKATSILPWPSRSQWKCSISRCERGARPGRRRLLQPRRERVRMLRRRRRSLKEREWAFFSLTVSNRTVKIYSDIALPEEALRKLRAGMASHELVLSANLSTSVLAKGFADPALLEAEIAFGQPDPHAVLE